MKNLKFIAAIIIVTMVSCTPHCPCTVTEVEKMSDNTYYIKYTDYRSTDAGFFSDSAYVINDTILY